MRPSVVVVDLKVLRKPLVHAEGEGIVAGADAAEDIGHSAERWVGSGVGDRIYFVKNARIGWASQRTSGSHVVGQRASNSGIDVGIDEIRQVAAEATEIADRNCGLPREFPLDGKVCLVNGGGLELRIEEDDVESAACAGPRRLCGQNLRELRFTSAQRIRRRKRVEAERELAAGYAGVDERVVDGGIDDTPVVDAVAAADGGFTVAEDIIGEADARPPVICIAGELLGIQDIWIWEEGLRHLFVIEADSEVQG